MKKLIQKMLGSMGYKLVSLKASNVTKDMDKEFFAIYEKCKDHTMTSVERMFSVYQTVKYVVENNIEGDFVEAGVWKGGSTMMAALSFIHFGDTSRTLYLYDTFEGMSVPTAKDVTLHGEDGQVEFDQNQRDTHNEWCYSPIGEVTSNMESTGYPKDKIVFVKGKVEDTIPGTLPEKVAALRLDTDWYESIAHCMEHQYPLVVDKGVVIIDDYGHWQGAREAVDEYLKKHNLAPLLGRIDYTGRLFVKRV